MADKKGKGLFMVWADVPADMEEDFNRWYNEEHMAELQAIPGVLSAARYEVVHSGDATAGGGSPRYLSVYELSNPEVRDTPEYKEHLIKPTEWSQRVNLGERATRIIQNNYHLIYPLEVTPEVAGSDMAPVLQVGRMSIPEDQEHDWNEFYNTIYAANYAEVPGCIRFRRYALYKGMGPSTRWCTSSSTRTSPKHPSGLRPGPSPAAAWRTSSHGWPTTPARRVYKKIFQL